MSRGDEFEAGEPPARSREDEFGAGLPPARRRMSDTDDDDAEREREERGPVDKRKRSGAVTAIGILSIIFASFGLLCGTMGICCGGAIAGGSGAGFGFLDDLMKQAAVQNPNDPNLAKAKKDLEKAKETLGSAGWVILGFSIFDLFRGILLMVGGVGVLKRINICRYLVLGMCVLGLLEGIASIAVNAFLGLMDAQGGISSGSGILIGLVFTGFAFFVLLNPKNAREFTGS
jgi:hypothetical protein